MHLPVPLPPRRTQPPPRTHILDLATGRPAGVLLRAWLHGKTKSVSAGSAGQAHAQGQTGSCCCSCTGHVTVQQPSLAAAAVRRIYPRSCRCTRHLPVAPLQWTRLTPEAPTRAPVHSCSLPPSQTSVPQLHTAPSPPLTPHDRTQACPGPPAPPPCARHAAAPPHHPPLSGRCAAR